MSVKYPDLDSKFPTSVDNIDKMQDLSTATKQLADQYYALVNAGRIDEANNFLISNSRLSYSIFNAAKFNQLRDSIIAVQRLFLEDISGFLSELHDLKSVDGGNY